MTTIKVVLLNDEQLFFDDVLWYKFDAEKLIIYLVPKDKIHKRVVLLSNNIKYYEVYYEHGGVEK